MTRAREARTDEAPGRRRAWLALAGLVALVFAAAGVWWFLMRLRPQGPAPVRAEARGVRSAVSQEGDSLQIVVQWQLAEASPAARAESLRVEVGIADRDEAQVRMRPGVRRTDTLYLPAPLPGGTADGYSCVAPLHRGRLSGESCTPWRYVRPMAQAPAEPPEAARGRGRAARAGRPARIVVQPSGMQVDPDVGGRCAAWQRRNPTKSVWIEVNRRAVPECTGPNGRPTVAQFCAFAELGDGRRVKTANSANIPYCDRLFRVWARERVS